MNSLPYKDNKPRGAADFYYAINAEFRYIYNTFGREAWIEYLREMAAEYFKPVNVVWKRDGLDAIGSYWREFFSHEPGAEVEVEREGDSVCVTVRSCPAIRHLHSGDREIFPEFCQHCYFLNATRAQSAGYDMRLTGGNGSCCHTYAPHGVFQKEQDLKDIRKAEKC